MLALREALERIPWGQLQHAYGAAEDTPACLLALLSPNTEEQEQALNTLWASIYHQGSVYEASCAAIPFLLQILDLVSDEQKPSILSFLAALAHRDWYANRDQQILRMDHRRGKNRQQWWSIERFLREGNDYHEPEWMNLAHCLVGEGTSAFLQLLRSDHRETLIAALYLLSGFRELSTSLVPAIDAFYSASVDPLIQATTLFYLGPLLDDQSPLWQHYQMLAGTDPTHINQFVQFAAVCTLAQYQPATVSLSMTTVLQKALLQPKTFAPLFFLVPLKDVNIYRLTLRMLAHLGVPVGLKALITVLEKGASTWNILDTARVVEALLDVAFFGDWVQDRYWNRNDDHNIAFLPESVSVDKEIHLEDEVSDSSENAYFQFDYGSPLPFMTGAFFLECWGYDAHEAEKLKLRFAQEGSAAFTKAQRQALQAVLSCKPFWQMKIDIFSAYGLPASRSRLKHNQFLIINS